MSIDTLKYAKELEAAGEKPKVAEAHATTLKGVIEENLVTKDYLDFKLKELTLDMTTLINEVIDTQNSDVLKIEGRFTRIETQLNGIMWIGGLALTGIGGLFMMMFDLMAQFN